MDRSAMQLGKAGVTGLAILALATISSGCRHGGGGGNALGLGDLLGNEPLTAGSTGGEGSGAAVPRIIGDIGGELARHVVDEGVDAARKDAEARKRAKQQAEMERARDYDQYRRLKERDPNAYRKLIGREEKKQ